MPVILRLKYKYKLQVAIDPSKEGLKVYTCTCLFKQEDLLLQVKVEMFGDSNNGLTFLFRADSLGPAFPTSS